MILSKASARVNLASYGIEVPLLDERVDQILNHLHDKSKIVPSHGLEVTTEDYLRVHTKDFVTEAFSDHPDRLVYDCYELKNGSHYQRFDPHKQTKPFTGLIKNLKETVNGTYEASLLALDHQFSFFLGGGLHHAYPSFGRGFCLFHDVMIAARKLQAEKKIKTVWVIDTDVHKGDGTAFITKGDPTVKTLSIHMKFGWPLNDSNLSAPWFTPSTIDIGIDYKEENLYLKKLENGLSELAKFPKPDFAFIVQGSDPYEKDILPSAELIKLSAEQMLKRDLMVYHFLKDRGIPQCTVMGGGYGPYVWEVYANFLNTINSKKAV